MCTHGQQTSDNEINQTAVSLELSLLHNIDIKLNKLQ